MQPYVHQYRSSFCSPTASSPEKLISAAHGSRKNMAGSQNSSSTSSDKDSLMSNERNITKAVPKCESETTEADLESFDDDSSELPLPSEEGSSSSNVNAKTDKQEVMKQTHKERHSNAVFKQPKKTKNIVMALKDEKVRETSSTLRSNRIKAGGVSTQKINTETETPSKLPKPNFGVSALKPNLDVATDAPSKATPDSAKQMQGRHTSKHQVHYH